MATGQEKTAAAVLCLLFFVGESPAAAAKAGKAAFIDMLINWLLLLFYSQ